MNRKEIKGFPNYTIDKNGNVKNRKGQTIKHEVTRNGYERVSLSNDSVKHKKNVCTSAGSRKFYSKPKLFTASKSYKRR